MQYENHLGQPIGFPIPSWTPPAIPPEEPMLGRFCRLERLDPKLHTASLHEANALDVEARMWTYLPYGPFETPEMYLGWVEEMSRRNDPLLYAIIDRTTGRAVGIAGYLRIDPPNGSIEVGHLSYSPLLRRSSAATEAMYLMMERVFDLGYRRYEWKCNSLNKPSRAAALRLGFSFEGIFRQAAVVRGRNRDTAWYSMLDTEWPARRTAFRRWLQPTNFDEQGKQRLRLSALIADTSTPQH